VRLQWDLAFVSVMIEDLPGLYDKLRLWLFLRTKALVQMTGANPKRSPPNIVAFVAGVHRSGTNMMMRILERSIDTEVFHESDTRAFNNYMMRGDETLRELIRRSPSTRIVFKSLHEAHQLGTLMTKYQPSRSIWMYRHYDDVVNSILKRWPGFRNMMDQIITMGDAGGWRGLGMTDRTRELLAGLYHESMNDATITALFWYQRNQLLFDQKLEGDRHCMLVSYEELARSPVENIRAICGFLDITYSGHMHGIVHARSIAKHPPPAIEPRVRALCEDLYERLLEASPSRRQRRDDNAVARASADTRRTPPEGEGRGIRRCG
jgi:hypothetical protein